MTNATVRPLQSPVAEALLPDLAPPSPFVREATLPQTFEEFQRSFEELLIVGQFIPRQHQWAYP